MPTPTRPPEERFWAQVVKGPQCWQWTGSLSPEGYGKLRLAGGRFTGAHRFSYELHGRQIPAGFVIDHLCHNRGCVNPTHLRAVPQTHNAQNRQGAQKRSHTGVRGVRFRRDRGKYEVRVYAFGRSYSGGYHHDLEAAERAAQELRARVMDASQN